MTEANVYRSFSLLLMYWNWLTLDTFSMIEWTLFWRQDSANLTTECNKLVLLQFLIPFWTGQNLSIFNLDNVTGFKYHAILSIEWPAFIGLTRVNSFLDSNVFCFNWSIYRIQITEIGTLYKTCKPFSDIKL